MRSSTKKIVITALFAALTFCATFVVQIPTPTGGYIHIGDSLVLVSAWILGPLYGTLAAGIGSALCDLFAGYSMYIFPTFVIKCLMALVACVLYRVISKKAHSVISRILSGICGGVVMVAGYYLVEATVMSYGFVGALQGVVLNIVQAVLGIAVATLISEIMSRIKSVSDYLSK